MMRSMIAALLTLQAGFAWAAQADWIEKSNQHAQALLEITARYAPEQASQLGVEGHDAEVFDLKPGFIERQVADLDALVTRTEERIESTTVEVQTTVIEPIREVSALLIGMKRAINTLFLRDRKQIDQAYQDEEMFI